MRVNGVLNEALQGKDYLVGNKCTYADLSFVTWDGLVPWFFAGDPRLDQMKKEYPNYTAWVQRLHDRPAVKKVLEEKAKASGH